VNRPLRRVAAACGLLLLVVLANLNYIQVIKAEDYRSSPTNSRVLLDEYDRQRGPIIVGSRAIASSKATDDVLTYLRSYRQGPLYAPATGFYSHVFGSSGVEKFQNGILSGTDDRLFVRRVVDLLTGKPPKGGSVQLTLNRAAQQVAYEELAGRRGAVVALEPGTGRILALVTSPSYDPNLLATHDGAKAKSAWARLNADEDKPLLDRALSETYPPGSTFKLVTASAALSSGRYDTESDVPGPAMLDLPQTDTDLPNYFSGTCTPGSDTTTMRQALSRSCNTTFGALGLELGDKALREQAEKYGLNRDLDVPMPAARSVFPDRLDPPQTAQSAIGQFDVRTTPLQMAMVVAGIANRGIVMTPYLVEEVTGPDLQVLHKTDPRELSEAVSPQVAAQLTDLMVEVVEQGTGSNAQIGGIRVAGKTGTAQVGGGRNPHAWFVSFAPADDPQVAVAVVLENGGSDAQLEVSGNQLAAPIARQVMEAVLQR
jgi:peptidoglycan glycosyltransferase